MNNNDRMVLLERHCIQLREHFSSVHIIAVRVEDSTGDATRFSFGKGSWYERFGALAEVLDVERERERLRVRDSFESGDEE